MKSENSIEEKSTSYITQAAISPSVFVSENIAPSCGGVDIFFGVVRNHHEGKPVKELFYDCYEPMAEKQIAKIIEQTKLKTGVKEIRVLHRIGRLQIGDIAVAISASGAHRDEAFVACRRMIDQIKEHVPIWKKETYEDLTQKWVFCSHQNKESGELCLN